MNTLYIRFALFLFCLPLSGLFAQDYLEQQLSAHVYFLSDDRLEGRATGSEGEQIALEYIAGYFNQYGLSPKGKDGYVQAFDFSLGKTAGITNAMKINNQSMLILDDYFPMIYSANANINANALNLGYGIHAPGLYDDYEDKLNLDGKVFVINLSSPDGIHPHSKYLNYTDYQTRIKTAQSFGASAVIFYNNDENLDDPEFDLSMKVKSFNIPVVFVTNSILNDGDEIKLNVDLKKQERTGNNVIAFIDNGVENTVVIGAHYDHLGWGESGGSLYRGDPAIHNGADDNASGVSLMLELARVIKTTNLKGNNYLFVAFSGEELGLYGSKSFVKDATIDVSSINYMLNFDMVGRLDEENTMAVNGVGTSPLFKEKALNVREGNIKVKTTESGMGPSDHASFYMADKPVLHFYTGNNSDYHKPSDDPYLINYKGMTQVFDFTYALIKDLDDEGKFEFVKTKDDDNRNAPKFSVTLGVVPDYMFDGEGLRIDGVTDGKPANGAGILAGDVVRKLGDIEITDMMAYMTALSKFKPGQSTIVTILRDDKLMDLPIQF
ncbi:MAG: M28 family peptidase [Chitinophagales bacterium]|tara:strand:+ start:1811 stop:3463 length:1653 start_codon:yes stop_codon:yes gene_type:complete